MTVILNNTILSNFSLVKRPDLVRDAFLLEQVATTDLVIREHENGIAAKHFDRCDWSWLTLLTLTENEQPAFENFARQLGQGESACLAIAKSRGMKFATDDKDARRLAQRLEIPITGTVGILGTLTKDDKISLSEADALLTRMIESGFHTQIKSMKSVLE